MKQVLALIAALMMVLSAACAEGALEAATQDGLAVSSEETAQEDADALDALEIETSEPEQTPLPGRLVGLKIGIDPGHQEKANSEKEAIAPGSKEKKPKVAAGTRGRRTKIPEYMTVLEISKKLRDALIDEGAEVLMTRETHDVDISNQERAIMMNEWGADLVLRIHCDGSAKKSPNGIGLFVNKSFPISEESKRAAEAILPRMVEATGAKRRGVYQRDTYTGLNWSEVPCILVECGYLTNPDEDERLNDHDYQQKLAEGMVEGICDYFGR